MSLELTMQLLDLQGFLDPQSLNNLVVDLDIQASFNSFSHDFLPDLVNNFNHLIAQAKPSGQFNQDVVGDMAKGWNNFIRTGQWAALLIGLVIGYMFRVFTSSG